MEGQRSLVVCSLASCIYGPQDSLDEGAADQFLWEKAYLSPKLLVIFPVAPPWKDRLISKSLCPLAFALCFQEAVGGGFKGWSS